MLTNDFEKLKNVLIYEINTHVTTAKEVEQLSNLLSKIRLKKEAKVVRVRRKDFSLTEKISTVISLNESRNVLHDQAIEELNKFIATWR